jgi:hypothetical protein
VKEVNHQKLAHVSWIKSIEKSNDLLPGFLYVRKADRRETKAFTAAVSQRKSPDQASARIFAGGTFLSALLSHLPKD